MYREETSGVREYPRRHPAGVQETVERISHPFRVCRKNKLCGSLCDLCASVVDDFLSNFNHRGTEDAQSYTEKIFFRQSLQVADQLDNWDPVV